MGKSTIALLLVLVGLVGVYQFVLKDKPVNVTNEDKPAASVAPASKLFDVQADQVKSFSWQMSASQYGEVKKDDQGTWSFVRPVTVKADSTKVNEFLTSILALSGETKVPLSATFTLATVQLEPVTQSVVLTMNDGAKKVLRVGAPSIDNSEVYVHVEGTDFATLIYSYQADDLKKMPTDLEQRPDAAVSPTP